MFLFQFQNCNALNLNKLIGRSMVQVIKQKIVSLMPLATVLLECCKSGTAVNPSVGAERSPFAIQHVQSYTDGMAIRQRQSEVINITVFRHRLSTLFGVETSSFNLKIYSTLFWAISSSQRSLFRAVDLKKNQLVYNKL